jgi:hypothetical protein
MLVMLVTLVTLRIKHTTPTKHINTKRILHIITYILQYRQYRLL